MCALLDDSDTEGSGYVSKDTFEENLKAWLEDNRDDDPEATGDLLAWADGLPWRDDGIRQVFVWW